MYDYILYLAHHWSGQDEPMSGAIKSKFLERMIEVFQLSHSLTVSDILGNTSESAKW